MEINDKLDLIKNFSKIWNKKEVKEESDNIPKENLKGYTDPAYVLMIIPKKYSIKDSIMQNFDVEEKEVLKLDYKYLESDLKLEECKCAYSGEYLRIMMELCKHSETIYFKIKNDYPMWMESEDMILILAPKLVNED